MSRFPLPVSSAPAAWSPDQLLRMALHAEDAYVAAVSEAVPLDFGVAFVSEEFDRTSEASCVRQVVPPADMAVERVLEQVDAVFTRRGLICREWVFADGRIPPEYQSALAARGFHDRHTELWLLQQPRASPPRPDLMIIPARASFAALAALDQAVEVAWETTDPVALAQYAQVAQRHLDDTRVEGLLVFRDGTPVARANLLTMGQLGLIVDFYVHPAHQRHGIGMALLDQVIELASRGRLRYVTLFCNTQNAPARGLYQKGGFFPVAAAATMERGEREG